VATARVQSESEVDLVARVRGGEREAFYELVRAHEGGIYSAALSIVNNDADNEEVVQEAIRKAFKAIRSAEAKFSTWIFYCDERRANEASKGPASPLRIARPAQEGRT
jgi:RNA polymerase sigma-70 factor (ECF subfamily)